jgi:hypothetical protein
VLSRQLRQKHSLSFEPPSYHTEIWNPASSNHTAVVGPFGLSDQIRDAPSAILSNPRLIRFESLIPIKQKASVASLPGKGVASNLTFWDYEEDVTRHRLLKILFSAG